jgi:hypothetical protein
MIESETGQREAGFRPVQAVTDFFVSMLLIGVNIKKVTGRAVGGGGGGAVAHARCCATAGGTFSCAIERWWLQVTKQNDMIQDLSVMKKGVDPSVKCVCWCDTAAFVH